MPIGVGRASGSRPGQRFSKTADCRCSYEPEGRVGAAPTPLSAARFAEVGTYWDEIPAETLIQAPVGLITGAGLADNQQMVKEQKGELLDNLLAPIPRKAVVPLAEAALGDAPLVGKSTFVVKR